MAEREFHGTGVQDQPAVRRWARELGLDGAKLDRLEPLGVFAVLFGYPLVERVDGPKPPEGVMYMWQRELAAARRTADQSELLFIRQARRMGWPWARISDALGLPGPSEAEIREHELAAIVARREF